MKEKTLKNGGIEYENASDCVQKQFTLHNKFIFQFHSTKKLKNNKKAGTFYLM